MVFISYRVGGSTPDLGIYLFIIRNSDKPVAFLSIFALNSIIGSRLT